MTSQIAKTVKRSTACYDLAPDIIEMIRKVSQQLDVPTGDIVAWCILTAMREPRALSILSALRAPTMRPGRFAYRIKRTQ